MTLVDLEPAAPDIGRPALPRGRLVDIGTNRTIHVRELDGHDGAGDDDLPLVLLHGAFVTAALNWCTSYPALAQRARVVSLDHRGHGRSFRTRRRFRLDDAADDVVALADALGIDRFVAVGYSMGGAVAQNVWHRHPDRIAGIVLCATWSRLPATRTQGFVMRRAGTIGRASRLMPAKWREAAYLSVARRLSSIDGRSPWIVAECRSGHIPMMLEGLGEIGRFDSSSWIPDLDVPAAVVVLTEDDIVPPTRQTHLSGLLPAAERYDLPLRHDGCVMRHDEFVPTLAAAVDGVLSRVPR